MDKPFLEWKEFDHPQLGKVEIGGWNRIWTFRNCPSQLLEGIAKKHAEYSLKLAASLPSIDIRNVKVEETLKGLKRVSAEIVNKGYLPTYLTDQAKLMKKDKGVLVKLLSEDNFEIIEGLQVKDIGELAGRSERTAPWSQWGNKWDKSLKTVSWLVDVKSGTKFIISAENEKAGLTSVEVKI
jgi:hypothetical protein